VFGRRDDISLLLEHLQRTLSGRTRFLVTAQELLHLGAIELHGPSVEQEVGPLDDRDGFVDQLFGCGRMALPRANAREHAEAERAFYGVRARGRDLGDLGCLRVPAQCVPRLGEEGSEIRPTIAPFDEVRVALVGDLVRGLRVSREHLDVEQDLGRSPVTDDLPGVVEEPAVALHRLAGGVELSEPGSEMGERVAHVALDPSIAWILADEALGPLDPDGNRRRAPNDRRGHLEEHLGDLVGVPRPLSVVKRSLERR
jgi:hypothetical protein